MSREWQYSREDIPETYYEAAVFLDKVWHYLVQVGMVGTEACGVITDAHHKLNTEAGDFTEKHVSTYIPK